MEQYSSSWGQFVDWVNQSPQIEKKLITLIKKVNYSKTRFGESQSTILHFAAKHNDISIATLAVSQNIPIDIPDNSGNTPLHYAAKYMSESLIAFLLQNGADPNSKNENGNTPLHRLIYSTTQDNIKTSINTISMLRNNGADPNLQNNSKKTPRKLIDSSISKGLNKLKAALKVSRNNDSISNTNSNDNSDLYSVTTNRSL